jgi:hypothetical protein
MFVLLAFNLSSIWRVPSNDGVFGLQYFISLIMTCGGVFGLYSSIKAKAYDRVVSYYTKQGSSVDWTIFTRDVERKADALFFAQSVAAFSILSIGLYLASDAPVSWWLVVVAASPVAFIWVIWRIVRWAEQYIRGVKRTPLHFKSEFFDWIRGPRSWTDIVLYVISVLQVFLVVFAIFSLTAFIFKTPQPGIFDWLDHHLHAGA